MISTFNIMFVFLCIQFPSISHVEESLAEMRRGSSLCLWYWRPKNFRTSSSKITGNENVITSTLAQEAFRTNHCHAVPFVILCASLVAFEIWWESIPESKRKYKVHKKNQEKSSSALCLPCTSQAAQSCQSNGQTANTFARKGVYRMTWEPTGHFLIPHHALG